MRARAARAFGCALAILVAAAGCRGGAATGCEAAVARGLALSTGEPTPPARRDVMRRIAVTRCKADAWPAQVVACLARAADVPRYQSCMARVPTAAYQALVDEMTADDRARPVDGPTGSAAAP